LPLLVVSMLSIKAFRVQPSFQKVCYNELSRSLTSNSFSLSKLTSRSTTNERQRGLFTMKYDDSPSKKMPRRVQANHSNRKLSTGEGQQQKESSLSDGVRLNKCLIGLSRRGADDAIAEGRVTINNVIATNGMKVMKRDSVRLDGKMQFWEGAAEAKKKAPSLILEDRSFIYLKYWKRISSCLKWIRYLLYIPDI
jgi:hypothetical protein